MNYKTILLIVFIFLFVFLCLIFPFKIKIKLHLNFLENKGFYSVKTLFINLLCGRLSIQNGKLEFENNNDMIFKENTNEDLLNEMFKNILKEMNVEVTEFYFAFGDKQDACKTALVCGMLESVFSSLYAIIKTKNNFVYQFLDIDPNYNKDVMEVTSFVTVSISIIKLLKCLVASKKTIKEKNSET